MRAFSSPGRVVGDDVRVGLRGGGPRRRGPAAADAALLVEGGGREEPPLDPARDLGLQVEAHGWPAAAATPAGRVDRPVSSVISSLRSNTRQGSRDSCAAPSVPV